MRCWQRAAPPCCWQRMCWAARLSTSQRCRIRSPSSFAWWRRCCGMRRVARPSTRSRAGAACRQAPTHQGGAKAWEGLHGRQQSACVAGSLAASGAHQLMCRHCLHAMPLPWCPAAVASGHIVRRSRCFCLPLPACHCLPACHWLPACLPAGLHGLPSPGLGVCHL